jgi:LAO/AO transport system kinase
VNRPSDALSHADEIAAAIAGGDRAALARGITWLESRRADRAAAGQAVLQRLLPRSGGAVRVGISGVPGVGKSTLLDALGSRLTGAGHKVAVLAVDPSSERTGGSILGDKTRMGRLAADANAYVRPSPASGVLGGVARTTREAMLLCEAAGFDVVFVETVGVGQSETMVARMVDTFVVLALPGAGDELQGIKKGIVELADLVAVTKADVDRLRTAEALRFFRSALRIVTPADAIWAPEVLEVSGISGAGLDRLWERILAHRRALEAAGKFEARRRRQNLHWFRSLLDERLRLLLAELPGLARAIEESERAVAAGDAAPAVAVERIIDLLKGRIERRGNLP